MASTNKIIFNVLANSTKYQEGMKKTVDYTAVATKAMKIGFVALSAAVVTSTVAFAKFEKGMSDISTIIDNSQESIKSIGDDILKLGTEIPKPIGELVESMYDIRSAGIAAAKATETLNSAGKLATVGLSTTKEATDILTTSMNLYASEGKTATQISNILFKTVQYGKNTIAQLAQAFGQTAPLAKDAGVSLVEFSAATASLTAQGIPAATAQNYIKAAMVGLQKQTASMQKVFRKLGYKDMKELMANSDNLGDAFTKIRNTANELDIPLQKVTGRTEGATAITILATAGADVYTRALYDMASGLDTVDAAFQRQATTLSAQRQFMVNLANTIAINFGEKLQPALIAAGDGVKDAMTTINDLITKNGAAITATFKLITSIAGDLFNVIGNSIAVVADLFNIFGGYQILTAVGVAIKVITAALSAITKVISTTVSAVSNMIDDFGILGQVLKVTFGIIAAFQAKAYLMAMFVIVKKLAMATKAWKIAQMALNLVMKANPIGLIITAVIGLGALIYDLITNFNEWKLSFNKLINSIVIGWKKAKALFAGEESKKAINEEIAALEAQNQVIKDQTEALKKRKEELKAKGMSSGEADKQAGAELEKKAEAEKTKAVATGAIQRNEIKKKELETSYALNEKSLEQQKSQAVADFNDEMVRAGENNKAREEAKTSYQEKIKELDNSFRTENAAVDAERKAIDKENELLFQEEMLTQKIEGGTLEQEALNEQKELDYQAREERERKFQSDKLKRGALFAKVQMKLDKLYNNEAVKSFQENASTLTQMSDSKNKVLAGIGKSAAIAQIAFDTPKAAMSAYSAMAGIPFIGPALGVAAAAAAIAYGAEQVGRVKSTSYAVGTDSVPNDMLANIHQGEGIIPKQQNQFLQSGKLALVSPDAVGEGGGSGSTTINETNVNLDGATFHGSFEEAQAIEIANKIAIATNEQRFAGLPAAT